MGAQPLKYCRMNSSASAAAVATATESETATAQNNYKIVQGFGNFAETEAQRPDFDHLKPVEVTIITVSRMGVWRGRARQRGKPGSKTS
jgi:hypothetical protein